MWYVSVCVCVLGILEMMEDLDSQCLNACMAS